MSIPPKEEVARIIESRAQTLVDLALGGWDRWMNNPEKAQLYRRTRACLVHNYIMLDAISKFERDGGVHVINGQETALFLIEDQLLVRIKKGDERGLSSNVATQAALAFNDPEELLFDLPYVWRIDVAYVLNSLETRIDQIVAVARDEDRIVWALPLYPNSAADSAPVQLPVQPTEPRAPDSAMRVPGVERDKRNRG